MAYNELAKGMRFIWKVLPAAVILNILALGNTGLDRTTPTGVRVPIRPEAAGEYTADTPAFPGLQFEDPVGMAAIPGAADQVIIVERPGRLILVSNLSAPERRVFLDISPRVNSDYADLRNGAEGLTSVAFHPNYARNGWFYVVYTAKSPTGNLNRLSRFERLSPEAGDPNSELVLIDQPDEGYGHNFNEVRFGPDGYLYVAVGDEGDGLGAGDEFGNSQRIDHDFFSAILRLDVTLRPGNLKPNPHPAVKGIYRIPADNPWVGAREFNGRPVDPARVRTEFYAVGFRNPWRMNFDPATGMLLVGDVGLHGWEEINVVVKGGNYGWAFREGSSKVGALGNPPPGVTLIPPIAEYDPSLGRCVIGGVVYRGSRFPELEGAYFFGDWMSGNLWFLRTDGRSATVWKKITGLFEIAGFGIDPRNGDVLLFKDKLNGPGDGIFRLERKPGTGSPIPPTLAGAGLFTDLASLTPAPGIVPYEINVPFWSDGAEKQRWFGMLDPNSRIGFNADDNWSLPAGTFWIKHFEIELEKGNSASRRRLETRVLMKNDGPDGLYGVTYRWTSANEASLVPPEGVDETIEVKDGNTVRSQTWRYPSRAECLTCHTAGGGYALGFNTPQLNRDKQYSLGAANQIVALRDAGYLDGPASGIHALRRLAGINQENWSRESRVRSFLAVNCANCHFPGALDRSRWDGRIWTPLSRTQIIQGELMNNFGNSENRVVKPGDPERSILLQRMKQPGRERMPPLSTSVVNEEAVQLIEAWIRDDLRNYQSFDEWIAASPAAAKNMMDDADGDGAVNWLEYLIGTDPARGGDAFSIRAGRESANVILRFSRAANRGYWVERSSGPGAGWTLVDDPVNRPFFTAQNGYTEMEIPISQEQTVLYRVRVFEP